jgi:hypothetical protein
MRESARTRSFRFLATACVSFALSCDLSCAEPVPPVPPVPPIPPASTADVTVTLTGLMAGSPALLLYSGREGTECVEYKPYVVSNSVVLDDVSYDEDCPVEITAFAPEIGAYGNNVDPSVPGDETWLTDAIATGALTIVMPGQTSLPLKIWLVADAGDIGGVEDLRDRLLDKAFPVLATYAAGVTLDTASSILNPSGIPDRCSDAGTIAGNPAIYDGSKLNVYFIKHYSGVVNGSDGYNCWMESHPEIMFVSWNNDDVTDPTLVHELGHALGLMHPRIPLGGHTYGISGFGASNLMATNSDVTEITVGQLYAMNFGGDSWMNRTGSPFRKAIVKFCQDVWGEGECPSLKVKQAGWPP